MNSDKIKGTWTIKIIETNTVDANQAATITIALILFRMDLKVVNK